ncbi:MAG: penicillin-binding protein 2 [Victivallales bacterium]|nr:penicillin-binding protein 2 [Victivallales bacterium]
MIRNNTIATRIKLFAVFALFLFALVFMRLYHVQITRHDELFARAKKQYTAVVKTQGKRGEIYDYSGNLLVGNVPCSTIIADPSVCGDSADCEKIVRLLAAPLGLSPSELYHDLMKKTRRRKMPDGSVRDLPRRYALLAKEVPLPQSERLQEALHQAKIKGIYFQENSKRYYPKNELLANILGFTNIDRDKIIAVLGIEKSFNTVISPTKTKDVYERALDGAPLTLPDDPKGTDGINIYLTVREPIQAIMEEELDKFMQQWHPRAAYAIMAEPTTGNIMAIAQRPTFNPNERTTMNPSAWRCRITEDVFEPGSAMKPIAISGAIDAGVVTPNTIFDCEGGHWSYGGKILRDSHPLEKLTVAGIIQKSSNIGTAKIALKMGEPLLYRTLRTFGFGQHTGIPMKPEIRGQFRPLKRWDTLSITRFPIGQGISCSPVQLVRAYCALANGGKLVDIRLVDRIEHPETGMTMKYPVKKPLFVFKHPETQRKIIAMMKMVTRKGGTATKAAITGYEVAGKTGTSQKFLNGAYSHTKFFATFIGFVPADNPRFGLLVTADEPQNAHYGGTVCGPLFRSIGERTLKYLNIPPDEEVPEPEIASRRRADRSSSSTVTPPPSAAAPARSSREPPRTSRSAARSRWDGVYNPNRH